MKKSLIITNISDPRSNKLLRLVRSKELGKHYKNAIIKRFINGFIDSRQLHSKCRYGTMKVRSSAHLKFHGLGNEV